MGPDEKDHPLNRAKVQLFLQRKRGLLCSNFLILKQKEFTSPWPCQPLLLHTSIHLRSIGDSINPRTRVPLDPFPWHQYHNRLLLFCFFIQPVPWAGSENIPFMIALCHESWNGSCLKVENRENTYCDMDYYLSERGP